MNELSSNENSFLVFDFGGCLITNPKEMGELVDMYNKTYKSEGEWSGGPTNSKFINYFTKKYESTKLRILRYHSYKPAIGLVIPTQYGSAYISYSAITKRPNSVLLHLISPSFDFGKDIVRFRPIPESDNIRFDDKGIVDAMVSISTEIYQSGRSLIKSIGFLDLNHIISKYPERCVIDLDVLNQQG